MALVKDPEALKQGKESFSTKCAACHAADGGGLVGPNLTDHFWINGKGELNDIYKVVRNGVLDKGMPAWGALMSDSELNSVVAYVKTLEGTKPITAKSPQGEEVK
jgi:cytochrome c oxidase cbb3-type subunit 3